MVEPKEALLRNVITHATGGNCTGEGMGLNDICVSISAHRNEVYARGVERGKATLAAENAALREKLAEREWRPIETAPRDEPLILALPVYNNKTGASWWEMYSSFIRSDDDLIDSYGLDIGWDLSDFTHWMPLPEPPALTGTDNAEG